MFKSTKEFDDAVCALLCQIRDGVGVNDLHLLVPEDDFNEALALCVDRGLVSGLSCQRMTDGSPLFSVTNLRVTYSGLQFIESH